jgi:hypothetical protein
LPQVWAGVSTGAGAVLMAAGRIRIFKHEVVPGCGSFEVRLPGTSRFFYFDDLASRRLRPDMLTREQALEQAKAFARAARDGIEKTMKFAADRPPTMLSRDGALAPAKT